MSSLDHRPAEPGIDRLPLPRLDLPGWKFRPAFLARRGNRVEGTGFGAALLKLTTAFYGASSDNTVRVGRRFRTGGLTINVTGAGNRIEIGDDVRLSGTIGLRGFGLTVRIGDRCDIKRSSIIACDADVAIGSDCLIAAGVTIRTSDMHGIADRASGALLNPPRAVVVGNNVWIAGQAALFKGARVADGCVVGFRSVVTGAFDESDCVIVGAPGRVIRRGISWTR